MDTRHSRDWNDCLSSANLAMSANILAICTTRSQSVSFLMHNTQEEPVLETQVNSPKHQQEPLQLFVSTASYIPSFSKLGSFFFFFKPYRSASGTVKTLYRRPSRLSKHFAHRPPTWEEASIAACHGVHVQTERRCSRRWSIVPPVIQTGEHPGRRHSLGRLCGVRECEVITSCDNVTDVWFLLCPLLVNSCPGGTDVRAPLIQGVTCFSRTGHS
jgi:hypothetical protein